MFCQPACRCGQTGDEHEEADREEDLKRDYRDLTGVLSYDDDGRQGYEISKPQRRQRGQPVVDQSVQFPARPPYQQLPREQSLPSRSGRFETSRDNRSCGNACDGALFADCWSPRMDERQEFIAVTQSRRPGMPPPDPPLELPADMQAQPSDPPRRLGSKTSQDASPLARWARAQQELGTSPHSAQGMERSATPNRARGADLNIPVAYPQSEKGRNVTPTRTRIRTQVWGPDHELAPATTPERPAYEERKSEVARYRLYTDPATSTPSNRYRGNREPGLSICESYEVMDTISSNTSIHRIGGADEDALLYQEAAGGRSEDLQDRKYSIEKAYGDDLYALHGQPLHGRNSRSDIRRL